MHTAQAREETSRERESVLSLQDPGINTAGKTPQEMKEKPRRL